MADGRKHQSIPGQNSFDIEVGASLQIQVGQLISRMESTLIGIRHGKYLIITMPRGPSQSAARLHEEGTSLIVRYIHNGNVYGFKAAVLNMISSPEKLLAITYPVHVEVYELRNYPRLNCFLPARVFIGNRVIDGSVIDISRTGAHYTCSVCHDINQLAEQVGDEIQLDVQLPGTDGYTHIVANLRSVHASSDKMELGIRFDRFDTHQLTNLLSFLLDAHALPEFQNMSGIIHKHYAWREKVSNFIHSDVDAEQDFALSADECDMGQWMNREGKTQYAGTDELLELEKVHLDLHHQVEHAINLRLKGEKEESISFFNKLSIGHISHRIAALLIVADENKMNVEKSYNLSMTTSSPAQPDTQDVDASPQATEVEKNNS
jgi:hypothetical protein